MAQFFIVKIVCCTMHACACSFEPRASSTFLSQQTNHQQPAISIFVSGQTSTINQPNEQKVYVS
jgi:hypothetical protein